MKFIEETLLKNTVENINTFIQSHKSISEYYEEVNNLNIDSLLDRIEGVKEVIVATNPNLDGETTALFIAKLLENKNIRVTRLAYGHPMGGNLEYSDDVTIMKSFENRKSF